MSPDYDIGLVIPLRDEFDAVREVLDFSDPIREDGAFLHPFLVPGSSVSGIAVVLFESGVASSAVAATQLLGRSALRMLAVVGVAAALEPELRLGDVVIASSVDEYLHGAKAAGASGQERVEFERGGLSWRAGADIVSFAQNFRYLAGPATGYPAWRDQARQHRAPELAAAIPALAGDYPDYRVGAIATGEVESGSDAFAAWIRQGNRLRLALETGAGGVAEAIYSHGRDQLIVSRGIAGFADERGRQGGVSGVTAAAWRRYAARNAAELLAAMVRHPLFPWPNSPMTAPTRADRPAGSVVMNAHASGNARIYQAGGDQHIRE